MAGGPSGKSKSALFTDSLVGGKKPSHLAPPSTASGDNYGLGVKAKIGKMRGDSVGYRPVSKKMLGKPPKSTV